MEWSVSVLGLTALALLTIGQVQTTLPPHPDCQEAQAQPYSTFNPGTVFGVNTEIGIKATPQRVGTLRQSGPLPTGHFATGHIKNKDIWPMILTPYQALLTDNGAVYDTYTMERWWDPDRTDYMDQQSAWEAGKPWNKLHNMGTNLRQITGGPDGNPKSSFRGKSGVQVRIEGASSPVMTSFGELYANFLYTGSSGTMELPLVRGASLLTHKLQNANPIVKPFCLSLINKKSFNFDCPQEGAASDGGTGYLSGSCSGGVLTITLHNSKEVKDVTKIQWAAEPSGNWGSTYMRSCDSSTCTLEDGGKTVKIQVPGASGRMSFALNYIGNYILPSDWTNSPEEVTCSSKRAVPNDVNRRSVADIGMSSTCQPSRDMTIIVDLGPEQIFGVDMIQYALEAASTWQTGFVPPMRTCNPSSCQMSGNQVIISTQSPDNDYKLAINIIGMTTLPHHHWIDRPYSGKCDGSTITDGPVSTNAPPPAPSTTTAPPPSTTTAPPPNTDRPQTTTPRVTVGPGTGSINYTTKDLSEPSTKFVMELNEPGSDLPGKTRKFILYFSTPVVAKVDTNTEEIRFEPPSGGLYNGLMQVAYAGSSNYGDGRYVSFFDNQAGVYSYNPAVRYCASNALQKAYVSFEWYPSAAHGDVATYGELMMVAMPHHALLLEKSNAANLRDTPFTFKGYIGDEWLMEYNVLHTDVDPDPAGVEKVKANDAHLQDMLAAIDRDAQNDYLDQYCSHTDSYNGGKGIGMSTRVASLSRAFGTNHYLKTDESIRNCLEKWLRVQDTLDDMWKFRYDEVWGGLFLRATGNSEIEWHVDYGFPYYNDHHFHLGYFLYALAYYVKHYPQWGQANKDRIYTLARDVGNPSSKDSFFPVSRQKDLYTGFSWASGLVPGTRQEESASESINCYHALAALGDAFDDQNMKQTGQVLLAMEVQSVREYWTVRNHNRAHFPEEIRKFGAVGMITEPDFFAYTLNWPCDPNIFPQRHACLIGIQVIPITAVSKYWVDQEWALSVRDSCEAAINPSSHPDYSIAEKTPDLLRPLNSGWQAFCYVAMARIDSTYETRAAEYVKGKRPQELVGGTGAASTLLFIYGNT